MELRCHDNSTVSGAASGLQWLWEKARRLEGAVEADGVALVRVSSVLPYHMGRYICANNVTREHSSIFVYVKGEEEDKEEAKWIYIVVEKSKVSAVQEIWRISFKLEGTGSADQETACKRCER